MRLVALGLLLSLSFPAVAAEFAHGVALHGAPKYKSGFAHFDYVNPDAPKGGTIRLSGIGGFDSLNPFILKGVPADNITGLVYQTLMDSSLDEPFSAYGALAESVKIADDNGSVTFRLYPQARWSDGKPVTADDVVFSFNTLMAKGAPAFHSYYADVAGVKATGDRDVTFTFKIKDNPELPLILGQFPVLPKHIWEKQKFESTTLDPALIVGSGPYKIATVRPGELIAFERIKDWWGKDLPVNKGMYNFDRVETVYFRDATVSLEAFFADTYDFRAENVAKTWATGYKVPQVQNKSILLVELPNQQPVGMQGYVFNIRKPMFKDKALREAIGLAFDFEWSNKRFAYGAYKRTTSYFDNSELASKGLPQGREKEILTEYKDQLPPELFTQEFKVPTTKGSGDNRANMKRALEILEKAGYTLNDKGQRIDPHTKKPISFEIIDVQQAFERWTLPFTANLKKLGIEARFRVIDTAQYQNRMNDLDFDMTVGSFPQSLSPGNEQRGFWSTKAADQKGSRNVIGIKDKVVDALSERIARAHSREELVALTRALDRVLLWGHYVVPHWHVGAWRMAYWDRFEHPAVTPPYGLPVVETWWRKDARQ